MADIKDRMKGGIENAADKAKTAVDRGAEAINGARSEGGEGIGERLRDNAQGLINRAGDYAGQAREAVQQVGDKAERWARDAYETTSESVGDFGKEVTRLVRNHPLPALLIGFGVGLLLGRTARVI
jgi:ElaB/YqjD/DUF883 family membrane-anchored ribosome-binding protein